MRFSLYILISIAPRGKAKRSTAQQCIASQVSSISAPLPSLVNSSKKYAPSLLEACVYIGTGILEHTCNHQLYTVAEVAVVVECVVYALLERVG